jgi:hypothetical protein
MSELGGTGNFAPIRSGTKRHSRGVYGASPDFPSSGEAPRIAP